MSKYKVVSLPRAEVERQAREKGFRAGEGVLSGKRISGLPVIFNPKLEKGNVLLCGVQTEVGEILQLHCSEETYQELFSNPERLENVEEMARSTRQRGGH